MVTFDPRKAKANRKKHGVAFSDARLALDDPLGLTREDWSEGEQRFVTLGVAVGSILVVTWTERHNQIRIISARKASAGEAKHYGN
ncbi:DUF500 domain containing protein [Lysobacter dokdonensis DS-58]|uniref:DUF500 domain containing protein n=1 Tax=Lysobacter dokdonensis DS-58 TaxID=1300345 RepID=A0A0A2WZ34_9GAMM|nr:BrnT family toxin [Lysobacter dokdonensis]KGQ18229.1 DUF500 domain containing protein [Lysobacter dokdonensis DS-58]